MISFVVEHEVHEPSAPPLGCDDVPSDVYDDQLASGHVLELVDLACAARTTRPVPPWEFSDGAGGVCSPSRGASSWHQRLTNKARRAAASAAKFSWLIEPVTVSSYARSHDAILKRPRWVRIELLIPPECHCDCTLAMDGVWFARSTNRFQRLLCFCGGSDPGARTETRGRCTRAWPGNEAMLGPGNEAMLGPAYERVDGRLDPTRFDGRGRRTLGTAGGSSTDSHRRTGVPVADPGAPC